MDIKSVAAAARARHQPDTALPFSAFRQDFPRCNNLVFHSIGKTYSHGSADIPFQQLRKREGAFDNPRNQRAGLCNPQMERRSGPGGKQLIGKSSLLYRRCFHRYEILLKAVFIKKRRFPLRPRYQRSSPRLLRIAPLTNFLFHTIPYIDRKRAAVDADAKCRTGILCLFNDSVHPIFRSDISRIDAYLCGTAVHTAQRKPVIKMNIGNKRHWRHFGKLHKCLGAFGIRYCKPENIAAELFQFGYSPYRFL